MSDLSNYTFSDEEFSRSAELLDISKTSALLLRATPPPAYNPFPLIIGVGIMMQDGNIHFLPKPYRHHDLIAMLAPTGEYPLPIDGEQGFVDDTMYFLDREKAAARAYMNGQCKKLHAPPDLYSEDLW